MLETLIEKYPNKKWNWSELSRNPNISLKFIMEHLDKPWNFTEISTNTNISIQEIENNMQLFLKPFGHRNIIISWDFKELSKRQDMTTKFIEKNPYKPWDWDMLSTCPNITLNFIEKNIEKNWNWKYLSNNPSITIEFVFNHIGKSWSWPILSKNFKLDIIEQYPTLRWNWGCISLRPHLTIEFIEKHKEKIIFETLSENKYITTEILKHFINEKWNWEKVSKHSPIEFIKNNRELQWNYGKMSQNLYINMEFIEKNINEKWDWVILGWNPNITIDFILEHSNRFHVYYSNPTINFDNNLIYTTEHTTTKISELCNNPNITLKFIEENIEFINWGALSINNFDKYFEHFKRKNLKFYEQFPWTIRKRKHLKRELEKYTKISQDVINEIVTMIY